MCDSAGVVRRSLSGRENWRIGGGISEREAENNERKDRKEDKTGRGRQAKTQRG